MENLFYSFESFPFNKEPQVLWSSHFYKCVWSPVEDALTPSLSRRDPGCWVLLRVTRVGCHSTRMPWQTVQDGRRDTTTWKSQTLGIYADDQICHVCTNYLCSILGDWGLQEAPFWVQVPLELTGFAEETTFWPWPSSAYYPGREEV